MLDPNINQTKGKDLNTTKNYKSEDINGFIIFDMAPPPTHPHNDNHDFPEKDEDYELPDKVKKFQEVFERL